jgi:tRNA modification GTPase
MRENMSNWNDTIVALATAPGIGAIAVIRLSGTRAIEIINSVFPKKDLLLQKTQTVHFGKIEFDNIVVDEVVITLYLSLIHI